MSDLFDTYVTRDPERVGAVKVTDDNIRALAAILPGARLSTNDDGDPVRIGWETTTPNGKPTRTMASLGFYVVRLTGGPSITSRYAYRYIRMDAASFADCYTLNMGTPDALHEQAREARAREFSAMKDAEKATERAEKLAAMLAYVLTGEHPHDPGCHFTKTALHKAAGVPLDSSESTTNAE